MANNFIFVRLEYSGGSVPTGWAEFQTDETAVLPGNLNITGNGRRITADFSNSNAANRLYFQTTGVNEATNIGVLPNGTSNAANLILYNTTNPANASRLRLGIDASTATIAADSAGAGSNLPLTATTAGVERWRAHTSGDFAIGQTSPGGAPGATGLPGWYISYSNGYTQARSTSAGLMDIYLRTGGATVFNFLPNGVTAGNVTCTATTTTYATSSDYRLKDDVQPLDPVEAAARIMAFRPVTWTWKVDGSYGKGFIAHECQAVDPMTATGDKDAVERIGNIVLGDGAIVMESVREPEDLSAYGEGATWELTGERPVYQGRDDSKMIPDMIAMMQRQESRIAELEAQLQYALTLLPVA